MGDLKQVRRERKRVGFLRRLLGNDRPRVEITIGGVEHEQFFDLGDQRGDLPADGIRLLSGYALDVVGTSRYRATLVALTGGPRFEGIRGVYWAALVPEPNNPYDANAISVRIAGQVVGHIARAQAKTFKPVLDRLASVERAAYCRADIRGGWNRSPTDVGDYGINIYVADADSQGEMLDRVLGGKSRAEIAASRPPKPALPDGRAKGPGTYRGRHHSEWHPEVARLRAIGADTDAELLLIGIVDATEREAAREGYGVAPGAYETLAVIYRRRKDRDNEIAILERYGRQPHAPGVTPARLASRLNKLRTEGPLRKPGTSYTPPRLTAGM